MTSDETRGPPEIRNTPQIPHNVLSPPDETTSNHRIVASQKGAVQHPFLRLRSEMNFLQRGTSSPHNSRRHPARHRGKHRFKPARCDSLNIGLRAFVLQFLSEATNCFVGLCSPINSLSNLDVAGTAQGPAAQTSPKPTGVRQRRGLQGRLSMQFGAVTATATARPPVCNSAVVLNVSSATITSFRKAGYCSNE